MMKRQYDNAGTRPVTARKVQQRMRGLDKWFDAQAWAETANKFGYNATWVETWIREGFAKPPQWMSEAPARESSREEFMHRLARISAANRLHNAIVLLRDAKAALDAHEDQEAVWTEELIEQATELRERLLRTGLPEAEAKADPIAPKTEGTGAWSGSHAGFES